ncbi:MAG: alpha/beta fold hydrolase [Hyphomicrobiales bacterium]|nr:alpha/beta fold hydrolase [Hyphomicrobiales bacterium]
MTFADMKRGVLALVLAAALGAAQARAEEVVIEHQGLDVVGNLEVAPGKSLKSDGVTLIVHDTLAHHRMEVISAQQDLLKERGVNTLAFTLSLGLDKRRGMYDCAIEQDHRHDDALDEIATWIAWAKEKGAASITLAGHGRGAAQVALYAERKPDKAVRRIVLISPLAQTFESAEAEYQRRYRRSLREVLAQAEQFVGKDSAEELLEGAGFLDCAAPKVTAGAFADYYAASPRFFTANLLAGVKGPALVVLGDQERASGETMAALQGAPARNVTLKVIPNADHYFSDLFADQLADAIAEFIKMRAPPGPQTNAAPAPG